MDRRKSSEIITLRIKLWGIVQGVGFRPFIAKLADLWNIKGYVRNLGGLVDIVATAPQKQLNGFVDDIKNRKPGPAEIVYIKVEEIPLHTFDRFFISDSETGDDEAVMIPSDLSVCGHCLAEMKDPDNPRFMHPFISCMECGPRYSIIDRIPYDRHNTAMADFPMCSFCKSEYTDRSGRRYHAQTISCHECGPYLIYKRTGADGGMTEFCRNAALNQAAKDLNNEGIVAVKGIGGYHLACSPFSSDAVNRLRNFKHREEKPFAVMFGNVDEIKKHCIVSDGEIKLLESRAKPIVLLNRKSSEIAEEVFQSSRFMGAFLPYTPLHTLLIERCGPLVMTSANLTDSPIIKDDEEMFKIAGESLSGILFNKRDIRVRLDDSVVRMVDGQPQMIRRSRGYAPVPLHISNVSINSGQMVLAMGGHLKAAFCLTKGPFAYVSQYFGDMDSRDTFDIYCENILRMKELLRISPQLAVCDMHPLYASTRLADEMEVPVLKVQHHHAHAASVIAEHDLKNPVIAVVFDGTGYGTDGNIWGGEFLVCHGKEYKRAGHLEYIKMIGGDSSIKEGWKSAICYLHACEMKHLIRDERYDAVKKAVEAGINTIKSSSMGRLFDAVSSFLEISDINRYEGECAVMLENAAADAMASGEKPYPMEFEINEQDDMLIISSGKLFRKLAFGKRTGISTSRLALGFHHAVAEMISDACIRIREKEKTDDVVLSGGVFQNVLLTEKTSELLRKNGFIPYFNTSVPPNDGGICLGQAYIGMKYLESYGG